MQPARVERTPGLAPARQRPASAAAPEVSEAFLQLTRELAEERGNAQPNPGLETGRTGTLIVPKSGRAALLAGLVVACLHASLDLGASITLGRQLGTISMGGQALPIVPLILFASLWSGARSGVIGLIFVRALLASLQVTHFGAYALCGGAMALLYGLLIHAIGWGDTSTLPIDIITGLAAGFFYRLFAGTQPA